MPRQGAVRDHEAVNATTSPALYDFVVSIGRQLNLCQNHDGCASRWLLLALPQNQDHELQHPVASDPMGGAALEEFHYTFTV
jgi:hypothetical protein